MHRKIRALRPLLRAVVGAAIVLAGTDLLLLVLRHWPSPNRPTFFGEDYLSVAISIALLAIVLVLSRRLTHALDRAESAVRLQQQVLDVLQAGLVLFDASGRILFCNRHFRGLYASLGAAAAPGASYEQLIRAVVAHGMVPEAAGKEEAWIAHRLAEFGRADATFRDTAPVVSGREQPRLSWRSRSRRASRTVGRRAARAATPQTAHRRSNLACG